MLLLNRFYYNHLLPVAAHVIFLQESDMRPLTTPQFRTYSSFLTPTFLPLLE